MLITKLQHIINIFASVDPDFCVDSDSEYIYVGNVEHLNRLSQSEYLQFKRIGMARKDGLVCFPKFE